MATTSAPPAGGTSGGCALHAAGREAPGRKPSPRAAPPGGGLRKAEEVVGRLVRPEGGVGGGRPSAWPGVGREESTVGGHQRGSPLLPTNPGPHRDRPQPLLPQNCVTPAGSPRPHDPQHSNPLNLQTSEASLAGTMSVRGLQPALYRAGWDATDTGQGRMTQGAAGPRLPDGAVAAAWQQGPAPRTPVTRHPGKVPLSGQQGPGSPATRPRRGSQGRWQSPQPPGHTVSTGSAPTEPRLRQKHGAPSKRPGPGLGDIYVAGQRLLWSQLHSLALGSQQRRECGETPPR